MRLQQHHRCEHVRTPWAPDMHECELGAVMKQSVDQVSEDVGIRQTARTVLRILGGILLSGWLVPGHVILASAQEPGSEPLQRVEILIPWRSEELKRLYFEHQRHAPHSGAGVPVFWRPESPPVDKNGPNLTCSVNNPVGKRPVIYATGEKYLEQFEYADNSLAEP